MRTGRVSHGELLGADRERFTALREINELRRSRALPEYQPRTTTFRVLPRQRHFWTRCVRQLH
ncbi:MAG: hypothetical protein ACRDY4_05490 [Acidimicrobiia bacterium]